jgi:hypothetical protein
MHELILRTRWVVFTKIESQQRPKEKTFLAGLHEEVINESGGDPPNFRRDNLFNSLLSFLAAHLSKAGGRLEFNVRNFFGRFALDGRLKRLFFEGRTPEDVVSSAIERLLLEDLLLGAFGGTAEQLATAMAGIFRLWPGRRE